MKYFLAGIKGSGMTSVASMLHDLGHEVVGCDAVTTYVFTEEELNKRNIKVYKEDEINELKKGMIFVYSSALSDNNQIRQRAKKLDLKTYKMVELISEIVKDYNLITVSGTSGKTTTSMMIATCLDNTIGTNYLIGDGSGKVNNTSKNFVLEADEFRRHFLLYYPNYAIITNINYDHVDIYESIDETVYTFQEFTTHVKDKIIACGDDLNVQRLKSDKIIYYGFNEDNDIIAKNIDLRSDGSTFDVYFKDNLYGTFNLNLYGKHMLLNALACIYICYLLGVEKDDTAKYLNEFKGAKRRFKEEVINNVIIVDDYAHHPNEVKTVIDTARQKYPDKKIVPVLLPYTFSRTEAFYKEFAEVLDSADYAYVTDIVPAREFAVDYPGVTHELILNAGKNIEHLSEETIDKLYKHDNAVIMFMCCKDPTWLIDAYKRGIKNEN